MKNLELLNVPDPIKEKILETDRSQRKYSSVKTDIFSIKENTIKARVEQFEKRTDKVFTQKELNQFGKSVFSHLPDGFKVNIIPLTWKGNSIEEVSAEWVRLKMKQHGKRQSDLSRDLGVDRHVISKVLNNEYGLTRWTKAAFWYYFQNLEK